MRYSFGLDIKTKDDHVEGDVKYDKLLREHMEKDKRKTENLRSTSKSHVPPRVPSSNKGVDRNTMNDMSFEVSKSKDNKAVKNTDQLSHHRGQNFGVPLNRLSVSRRRNHDVTENESPAKNKFKGVVRKSMDKNDSKRSTGVHFK